MKMVQTSQLRFISRPGLSGNGPRRILQQRWVVDQFSIDILIVDPDQYAEWRDVPMIEEPANASG